MRDWLKDMQAMHGGRCHELIIAAAKYMELRLPEFLSGTSHTVHFEICPQQLEASSEHLAFKLALKWGKLKEKDAQNQTIIESALLGDDVGNLAWGNGSMQGFPDGSTYINAELGLKHIIGYLTDEVESFGSIKEIEDKKGKQKKVFTFGDKKIATQAIERTMRKTMRRLVELAPRLPMPPAAPDNQAGSPNSSEAGESFGFGL